MIRRLENGLVKVESVIAALSLFLLLLLSVVQMLTRNLFELGFPEIEIINRYLLVICGSMGAVIATSKLRHIKVDAFTTFMSKRLLSRLRCPLALFSAVVCAILSYHASIFVADEWQYVPANERWTLPFTLVYPIGFGLLALHFLFNCFLKKA
ncbi:MAG: TRAP transporter small permease [Gammaproteobacteria bacterium]|nr:TRAP transporter small permease [Gammaproteobacteria bacterium]NNJ96611.1 TRAP transporter small permease [Gammaproteobacteria bacterium]